MSEQPDCPSVEVLDVAILEDRKRELLKFFYSLPSREEIDSALDEYAEILYLLDEEDHDNVTALANGE